MLLLYFGTPQSAIQAACAVSAVNQRRKSSKFHSSIFMQFRAPSRPQTNSFIIVKISDHSIPVGKLDKKLSTIAHPQANVL